MKCTSFIYNGKWYTKGAIFIVKQTDSVSGHIYEAEAIFLYYFPESNRIEFEVNGKIINCPMDMFNQIFVHATDRVADKISVMATTNHQNVQQRKITDEFNIDGLLLAWMWYIFIMVIAIIFKDCIGIWIIASIIFFDYRNKKLKEAGYK